MCELHSSTISGGARVFAASACQISYAIRVCFQDFGHGDVNQPLGVHIFFLPSPSLSPISYPFSSNPLEVGPLNSVRSGGVL